MNEVFRVLIATQDLHTRLMLEGLLKAVRARFVHADTEESIHSYLKTPEGFDMVVVDGAWEFLSIHGIHLACRSRSKTLSETHLMVILPSGNSTQVIGAFNDGADTVLRQPIRPLEFLNACRTGQHLTRLTRSNRALSEPLPAPAPASALPEPASAPMRFSAAGELIGLHV
ncbi:hypothetical protein SAMN05444156_1116 [Verrucomicrobium sp. GAS474]|uniref:response regulator transcription factor n=1 Tax=Verrucomicrobium sp. GAS474 TaxID=1882831 RepID=UPI00087D560A|nr:response regulator transcription factor [Verrucomicrobium sp. GAS474]SDT96520.1 hypothetical protein SAMN05444156_1116 [Verrucomicrobium sp. GAS474]